MSMDDTSQLDWVARNRARPDRRELAGEVVAKIVDRLGRQSEEPTGRVAEILAGVVDEEFRRHCRVGRIVAGTLAIQVDEPARVSVFTRLWSLRVLEAVRSRRGCGSIRQVVFEVGSYGRSIPLSVGAVRG